MEQDRRYRVLWQKKKEGEARLLRMYGETALAEVPDEIEGYPLTEIASYCFAQTSHLSNEEIRETNYRLTEKGEIRIIEPNMVSDLQELCGTRIEEVRLSDQIREIGNCAFYNCKNLKKMELGVHTEKIGSDAFMNTLVFRQITLRCGAAEKSGLKQILSQIMADMEVTFAGKTEIEAVLLYPEYYEVYDEIAPAHIFGRSIAGEGFRARQAFLDGVVDFAGYDGIFPQACVEESVKTLSQIALNRLQYPRGLSEEARMRYQNYVKEHIREIANRLTKEKELQILQFLCRNHLLCDMELAECISLASEFGWAEGAAELLRIKADAAAKSWKSRYEFEDF